MYEIENNTDLLYSTGNYIQYLTITYNGKASEKAYIYVFNCITLLHTWNTVNQLYSIFLIKKKF